MDAPSSLLNTLHYLFSEFGDKTVAHCLDLDIVTSGTDLSDAEKRLDGLVQYFFSTSAEVEPRQAPREYWRENSSAVHLDSRELEIEIPPHVLEVKRKEAIPVLRSSLVREAA